MTIKSGADLKTGSHLWSNTSYVPGEGYFSGLCSKVWLIRFFGHYMASEWHILVFWDSP